MYTPPRPSVEKYTHRTTDRATADEGVGRAATDRSIDRCSGGARGGARGGGRPDVASTSSDARREGDARASTR